MSNEHEEVPSTEVDANTTADVPKIVKNNSKEETAKLTIATTKQHSDKPNNFDNPKNTSTVHTDAQRVAYDMKTAGKKANSVRTHRIGRRTQCSPDKPHPSPTINGEGTVSIISTSTYRGMSQMRCRRMRVEVLSLDKSRVQVMRSRPTANMEVMLRTRWRATLMVNEMKEAAVTSPVS